MEEKQMPKIGVGVIIMKGNKILLGKRKNAHGEGCWSPPGGHLEFNESIEDCARREAMEETGIQIKEIKLAPFTNDIFQNEGKHYVTAFVSAKYDSGEVKLTEPERWEEWAWFDWDNLPQPLFLPVQNLLKQNYNPFQDI